MNFKGWTGAQYKRLLSSKRGVLITSDFYLEVSKGIIPGHSTIHKFGHNPTVGTSQEDLWSEGGLYVYPSSASTMTISSSDTNDTSAGTGARTVTIFGLDASYNEINENITLNGQTGVNSINSYIRVYRLVVRSAGSNESNVGNIYLGVGVITAGKPATVYASIDPIHNQTLMSLYTVPAGKTAYVYKLIFSTGTQKATDCFLFARPFGEVFQIKEHYHLYQNMINADYKSYIKLTEKTDIAVRGKTSATTTSMTGYLGLVLVDNV